MHIAINHPGVDVQVDITAKRVVLLVNGPIGLIISFLDNFLDLWRFYYAVVDCDYVLAPLVPGVDL
jgi:hypothetical protein